MGRLLDKMVSLVKINHWFKGARAASERVPGVCLMTLALLEGWSLAVSRVSTLESQIHVRLHHYVCVVSIRIRDTDSVYEVFVFELEDIFIQWTC